MKSVNMQLLAVPLILSALFTPAALHPHDRFKRDAAEDLINAFEKRNETEAIRLIENGAHINAHDTILHAAILGLDKAVEALIKHGADLNETFLGAPPFIGIAAGYGSLDAMNLLLRHRADVNARDHFGQNSLHAASYSLNSNDGKRVETLINHGADMNAFNNDGETPLYTSVKNGNVEVLKMLLRHGANRDLTNTYERPRDKAVSIGDQDIIDLFDLTPAGWALTIACDEYSAEDLVESRNAVGETKTNEFPWMAALGYVNLQSLAIEFKCSGTIISDLFVLTAAHCIKKNETQWPSIVRVLGSTDSNVNNYFIEEIIQHPQFSEQSKQNDIALIRLTNKIVFTSNIRPACLETHTRDLSSELQLNVTSWESTNESKQLRRVNVVTMPLSQCNQTLQKWKNHLGLENGISEGQYCVFDLNGKSDANIIWENKGMPLQIMRNPDTAHVIGIASFGGIGRGSFTGVYTRVAYYADWIAEHVWPESLNSAAKLGNQSLS